MYLVHASLSPVQRPQDPTQSYLPASPAPSRAQTHSTSGLHNCMGKISQPSTDTILPPSSRPLAPWLGFS